ncbi:TMV resistance protein N-like [Eucalyptus grandis]|uniref:TMV resistance protein N-like n=1 Tax=Eucalyptus grandis TaxID=71139 RepID=UPI00192F0775|nr:TMV resistance protein N-like [Eucalyptus grandis]
MAKTKGLVSLQKRLLSDISNSKVASKIGKIDQGINWIGDIVCNEKVLIVLDDVDECNQIQNLVGVNSLYPGTRILVTTRDKRVLNMGEFKYQILHYEMESLSHQDALQLFSRHAFDDDAPLGNYYTLSRGFVSTTGGLPLALLAIEVDQKQIFLDIACFFISHNKIGPISLWKDYGFRAEDAIKVLQNMSMIKVLDDNSFWMHDQFRYFGREIAEQEHTWFWDELRDEEDITYKLRWTKIKGSVRALYLRAEVGNPITVTVEQIKQFPHLQLLWLSNVICRGDLTGCLSELKWISLDYSRTPKHYQGFEATNLPVENVVGMELFGHEFTVDKVRSLTREVLPGGALILVEMDGQELPKPVNADVVKKYQRILKEDITYPQEINLKRINP